MARRPTITDVAKAAGVSVATVDRVLNGRHPVREETAHKVLVAAESVGFYAAGLIKQRLKPDAPERTLGFVLQKPDQDFYRGLAAALKDAVERAPGIRGRAVFEFAAELSPSLIADKLRAVGGRADAVAVVSVDHPTVGAAVDELRGAGVPVFALLTDLLAASCSGYIGIDNRKAGRMAAWAIARTARSAGEVGILVGSHRYLGHEMREIGFRSYFREHAPGFRVLDALANLDEPRLSHEATLDLAKRHPGLVGICVAGGGMEGVIAALREDKPAEPLSVVVNELTPVSRAALLDGVATLAIATPVALLAQRAVESMAGSIGEAPSESTRQMFLPFDVYTSENL